MCIEGCFYNLYLHGEAETNLTWELVSPKKDHIHVSEGLAHFNKLQSCLEIASVARFLLDPSRHRQTLHTAATPQHAVTEEHG